MRRLGDLLRTIGIAFAAFAACISHAVAQTGISAVWANDGGDKVLREERRASGGNSIVPAHGVVNTVWDGKQINLFAARNEVVSFNLVIESSAGASGVSVALESLAGPAGAVIQSRAAHGDQVFDYTGRNIELFKVGYLPIKGLSMLSYEMNDERWIPSKVRRPFTIARYGKTARTEPVRGKDGWADRPGADKHFPEIAVPLETTPSFDVAAGTSQSIWADIYVPKSAATGIYEGTLQITERGSPPRVVPVTLAVRNFALPDTPSAVAISAVGNYDISERFLGIDSRFADYGNAHYKRLLPVLERYWQMLHRHRVVPMSDEVHGIAPPSADSIARVKGTMYSAAKGYDGPGKDTGDSAFFIGPYGSWKWNKGNQAEFNKQTDAWMTWFAVNAPRTRKYIYLIDEPNLNDAAATRQINDWLDKIAANPGIGRRLPTFVTAPAPLGREKIPRTSVLASWYSVADTASYQRAVNDHLTAASMNEVWQYNGKRPATGSFAIEDDGTALRALQWAAYKKGIAGWFFWNVSYYYDYQSDAGRTDVWRQAKTFGAPPKPNPANGEASPTYGNGDGVLAYPGVDRLFPGAPVPGLHGPVASLRLKLWRRGIQDIDYLTLAKARNPDATQWLVEKMVPKVLWETGIYNPQNPTYQFGGQGDGIGWTINPDDWENARKQLADIIEGR